MLEGRRALRDRPFVEVGYPDAVATADDLIVVAGTISGARRHPVGLYTADLRCERVLSTPWPAKAIAIHPSGRFVAVGVGSWDEGGSLKGQLLVHDRRSGITRPVLTADRYVVEVEWERADSLRIVAAPVDEEDLWDDPDFDAYGDVVCLMRIHQHDWAVLGVKDVNIEMDHEMSEVQRSLSPQDPQAAIRELARWFDFSNGNREVSSPTHFVGRSQDGGVIVAAGNKVEKWDPDTPSAPRWVVEPPRYSSRVLPLGSGHVVVSSLAPVGSSWPTRIDALVITTRDGQAHAVPGPSESHPALPDHHVAGVVPVSGARYVVWINGPGHHHRHLYSTDGELLGRETLAASARPFALSAQQRVSSEYFVMADVADPRRRWAARLEVTPEGRTLLHYLFPLTWDDGTPVDGAVLTTIGDGPVVDLLQGGVDSPFLARRRLDGDLVWFSVLSLVDAQWDRDRNIITGVVKQTGELAIVDAVTGADLGRGMVTLNGIEITLTCLSPVLDGTLYAGTADGRAVELTIDRPR